MDTTAKLRKSAEELRKSNSIPSSVHHVLLKRGMAILRHDSPELADKIQPMMKYMLHVVKKPDHKGDYEKGMGRHYYCSLNYAGKPVSPICGYYRNGLGHFGKSARSMFEEDYTMALAMYKAGFIKQASSYLGRAVHMLCDICCLPHAASMTYFSPNAKLHKAYEDLASYIYPSRVPERTPLLLHFFKDRSTFEGSLNYIAEVIRNEIPQLKADPIAQITARLYDTEFMTASLLERFAEDTELSAVEAHYIADGTIVHPMSDYRSEIMIRVTECGLMLISDGMKVVSPCRLYAAAHRKDGIFSLMPVRCHNDMVLTDALMLERFDPRDTGQQFHT